MPSMTRVVSPSAPPSTGWVAASVGSPTIASSMSAAVTRPSKLPYSSITSARPIGSDFSRSSASNAVTVSGTMIGWRSAAPIDNSPPPSSRSSRSFAWTMPTTLSIDPSHTTKRECGADFSAAAISFGGSVRSIQANSVRGVMIARTGLSARRSTRSIMSRSSVSRMPAWAPSISSAFNSSSVTAGRTALCRPNRRRMPLEEALSSQTTGPTIVASPAIGRATQIATGSGRRRARCLGTSSPSTIVR